MRREKLRSERAQLYFLLFLWNNSLMNTDIILVFLVSVYLMCLCFFPFHLHIGVHFYAADIHECPSVPRGRIIRYGTDRIFRTEFECVPFFIKMMMMVKTQSNQETRSTIQVRYAKSSVDAFLSRGT